MPTGPRPTRRRAEDAERSAARQRELADRAPEREAYFRVREGLNWQYAILNEDATGGAGNKATAQPQELNDDENDWIPVGDTREVYVTPLLPDDDTIEAGTWVKILEDRKGRWWLDNAACAGTST